MQLIKVGTFYKHSVNNEPLFYCVKERSGLLQHKLPELYRFHGRRLACRCVEKHQYNGLIYFVLVHGLKLQILLDAIQISLTCVDKVVRKLIARHMVEHRIHTDP
jgi:hypothetical protein